MNLKLRINFSICVIFGLLMFLTTSVAKDNLQKKDITIKVLSKKVRPLNQGNNEAIRDDVLVRLRLENNEERRIFYLATGGSIEPVVVFFRKKTSASDWVSDNSQYLNIDSFTGVGNDWLMLPPGTAVEFEILDKTIDNEEHKILIYINNKPDHKNRSILFSESFVTGKILAK